MNPRDYYQQLVKELDRSGYSIKLNPANEVRTMVASQVASEIGFSTSEIKNLYKKKGMNSLDFESNLSTIIEGHTKAIFDSLPTDQSRKLHNKVYAGLYPTGEFNAEAVLVPGNGGYLFLINFGLMMLINVTSKIIFSQAGGMDTKQKTQVTKPLLTNKEAGEYLRDTIRQYLTLDEWRPTYKQNRIVLHTDALRIFKTMLTDNAEKFVLAHEFSHAILGHLDRKNLKFKKLALPNGKSSISVIEKNWNDEFEADALAGLLFFNNFPKNISNQFELLQVEMALAAPIMIFELQKAIEKVGNIRSTSHPPAEERIKNLGKVFRSVVSFDEAYGTTNLVTYTFGDLAKYL